MIRLIATDLDGTIINENNQCDLSVVETVRQFRENGIRFAVCSGRPVDSYLHHLKRWGLYELADYVIGSNGGEVLETATGRRSESYLLPPELYREIIDLYRPLGCMPTIYAGTTLYVPEITEGVRIMTTRVGVTAVKADIDAILTKPMIKEMFIVDPSNMASVEAFAAAHPDDRYVCFKTAVDLFEVNHPKLAKDAGMAMISEMTGIKAEEMMAFGDTTNDIPMLKYVKYGICMANGSEDALSSAYAVAPAMQENGFAQYLKVHLKGNEFID